MSKYPVSGIVIPKPLKGLKKILQKWQGMMKSLANEWAPDDVPWWNPERTLVGLFASAVWLCGGQALEEYTTEKKALKRGKPKSWGRGDIWFAMKKRAFLAEAKSNSDFSLDGDLKLQSIRITNALRVARKDAVRTRNYGKTKRLGLLFLIPWRLKSKGEPTDTQIRTWLGPVRTIKNAAIAWTFPRVARQVEARYTDGKDYYYPGVVIIIQRPRA